MEKEIRIGLAGCSNEIKKSITRSINQNSYCKILFELAIKTELINTLNFKSIDILIFYFKIPIIRKLELIEKIKSNHPEMKIVLVTFNKQPLTLRNYLKLGIDGIIPSDFNMILINHVVESLLQYGFFYAEEVLNAIILKELNIKLPNKNIPTFSSCEIKIIKLICQEKSSQEIGEILFISRRTVDGYRLKIMHKINARSSIGIVKYAIVNGFYISQHEKYLLV